jgi:hypothetical protein
VMLSGFLGFRPTPEGCGLAPRLPGDWPSLEITGIHVHDHVVDIRADRDGRVRVRPVRAGAAPLVVEHAGGRHVLGTAGRPLLLGGPPAASRE